jgi:hypothetical protein
MGKPVHMSAPQTPNSPKRKHPCPSHQKLTPSSHATTLDWWDSLSKIWLTRDALRELDWRNARAALLLSTSQARRPVTRGVAAWKKSQNPLECPSTFLRSCRPEILKAVKLLAKHGGPDLSNLRGVSVQRCRYGMLTIPKVSCARCKPNFHELRNWNQYKHKSH